MMSSSPAAQSSVWQANFLSQSRAFELFRVLDINFSQFTDWPTIADYNCWARDLHLQTPTGLPLTFAAAEAKPKRTRRKNRPIMVFERRIFIEGVIVLRQQNWHDFFNALTWCLFPETKWALNERQCLAYAGEDSLNRREGIARTEEQDYLAIFDEGGIILAEEQDSGASLRLAFGHALYESIIYGKYDVRAMTYVLREEANFFANSLWTQIKRIDELMAKAASQLLVFQDKANFTNTLLPDLL